MDRYAATTEHLRDAACDLLVRRGTRAFTQDALAESAYVAIGTVYQRWSSKAETVADIVGTRLLPGLTRLRDGIEFASPSDCCVYLFDRDEGRRLLVLAAEVLLAARDHGELGDLAGETVLALAATVGSTDGAPQWWATSTAIGWGMLLGGDIPLPPVGAAVAAVVEQTRPSGGNVRLPLDDIRPVVPAIPEPVATDDAGSRLKSATRRLLSDPERSGLRTRDLTMESGVPTGTMYRRFASRSELLRAVLIDEVQSARYAWSEDMVAALTGNEPIDVVVDVVYDAVRRVYADRDAAALILEITVAARRDTNLREQLVGQIANAVDARRELFERLQAAGVLADSPTPDQISWLFQAPPIGTRLLGALGRHPSDMRLRSDLRRVIETLVAS